MELYRALTTFSFSSLAPMRQQTLLDLTGPNRVSVNARESLEHGFSFLPIWQCTREICELVVVGCLGFKLSSPSLFLHKTKETMLVWMSTVHSYTGAHKFDYVSQISKSSYLVSFTPLYASGYFS